MRCKSLGLLSSLTLTLAACGGDEDPAGDIVTATESATFTGSGSGTEGAGSTETATAEGTGDGDGDGSSGDGDGTAGDGDGASGDGDGTTGDGDGSVGDGDGTSGDGDGDGSVGDGDGTSGDGDDGCFDQELSFEPFPPSIVLVLDKSGSMTTTYDHDNNAGTPNVTRWEAVHIAVTDVLNVYESQVEFGMKLFPTDDSCGVDPGVDVACAPTNASTILASIPAANASVNGSTPSGEGLSQTLSYLQPLVTPGNKAIIFMADGDLNCGTPGTISETVTMLDTAYNGGGASSIPTYVVGINASGSTVGELNALAVAGGVPLPGNPGCEWLSSSVNLTAGTHTVTFNYSKDGSVNTGLDAAWIDNLSLTDGGSITFTDGFESGDFSGGTYTNGGNLPWTVLSSDPPASGVFSARSGAITHSQNSTLNLQVTLGAAGTLNFDYRTDTEANFDEMTVSVDGSQLLLFDGSTAATCDAQFYDAQNTAEFYAALDGIIGNLVTCDLVLDPPPPIPDNIDVEVGGMLIPQLDPTAPGFDCDTQSGWYYSSPSVVTLCGQTCDDFKNMSLPTADVTYYCTPD
jgi:hypothetical protein